MDGNKVKNMEEFAALSGISRPTLSKYFHDPASVRVTTRNRIEKALSELFLFWQTRFLLKSHVTLNNVVSQQGIPQCCLAHTVILSLKLKF